MKKNKIKKILTISGIVLLMIATLGTFAAFFGKNDFSKVKDKWNDIKDKFQQEEVVEASPNLIYNSNFKINTTGSSIFNNSNELIFDGWKINTTENPNYEMVLVEDGLFVKVPTAEVSDNIDIGQHIMDSESVIGQVVTMSISLDGVVYSKTLHIENDNDWSYSLNTDKLVLTLVHYTKGISQFIVRFKTGFEGTINWVQLEQGSIFTGYAEGPAEYVSPVA